MGQPPQPLSEKTFRAFVRASGLFRHTMRPYFASFGVSGAQWGVLRALYRAELDSHSGLRQIELGQRLLVRAPSITGLVDRLVRMRLVRRETARDDLRAKHVRLTPLGRQLVTRIQRDHASHIKSVMAGLTGADQRDLHRLMIRFGDHLESQLGTRADTMNFADEEVATDGK